MINSRPGPNSIILLAKTRRIWARKNFKSEVNLLNRPSWHSVEFVWPAFINCQIQSLKFTANDCSFSISKCSKFFSWLFGLASQMLSSPISLTPPWRISITKTSHLKHSKEVAFWLWSYLQAPQIQVILLPNLEVHQRTRCKPPKKERSLKETWLFTFEFKLIKRVLIFFFNFQMIPMDRRTHGVASEARRTASKSANCRVPNHRVRWRRNEQGGT